MNYDLLHYSEKDFCERQNLLPSEYMNLKMKIVREQSKVTIINDQLIKEKIRELGIISIQ